MGAVRASRSTNADAAPTHAGSLIRTAPNMPFRPTPVQRIDPIAPANTPAQSMDAGARRRWIISTASVTSSIPAAPMAYPMSSVIDTTGGAVSPKTDRTATACSASSTLLFVSADRMTSTSPGAASASAKHPRTAAIRPRASGAGRTSFQASLVVTAPAISASTGTLRARASSARSRNSAAAPSEETAPRRGLKDDGSPVPAAGRCHRRTRNADWTASHSSSAHSAITASTPGYASSICAC